MNTMVTHTGARQVYESYTVTVTYEVRAFRDDWNDDGWLKESCVLESFKEEFAGDDIDAVGLEANVSDYKIVRGISLETYTETELMAIRNDLRAMCVSQHVIEYVEACCRMAYAMGDRDGLKEGRAISIAREQKRLSDRVAYVAFGDC